MASYKTNDVVRLVHRDKMARTGQSYTIDIWDKDNSKTVDGASCSELSNGIYYYEYEFPAAGAYIYRIYTGDHESTGSFSVEAVGSTVLPASADKKREEREARLEETLEELKANMKATPGALEEVRKMQEEFRSALVELEEKTLSSTASPRDVAKLEEALKRLEKSYAAELRRAEKDKARVSKEEKKSREASNKELSRLRETTLDAVKRAEKSEQRLEELTERIEKFRNDVAKEQRENVDILSNRLKRLDAREQEISSLNSQLLKTTDRVADLAAKKKNTRKVLVKDEKELARILEKNRKTAHSLAFKGKNTTIRVALGGNFQEGERFAKEYWSHAVDAIKAGAIYNDFAGIGKADETAVKNILAATFKGGSDFSLQKTVDKIVSATKLTPEQAETIVRTEQTAIANKAREIAYKERDPEGDYRFKWSVKHDHRTSEVCEAISRDVRNLGGGRGVPLKTLEKIMKENVQKYMGSKWEYRDWTPHPNCRSTLVRVVR